MIALALALALLPGLVSGGTTDRDSSAEVRRSAEVRQIVRYLETRYDNFARNPDGAVIYDLAYIPEIAPPPVPFESPIAEFLPDTRFYVTQLATGRRDARRVETLVSASAASTLGTVGTVGTVPGEGLDIRTFLSPVYSESSAKFVGQFVGVRARGESARVDLSCAIGQLLAGIAYEGSTGVPEIGTDRVTVPLWHSTVRSRTVEIGFDPEGAVMYVLDRSPRE